MKRRRFTVVTFDRGVEVEVRYYDDVARCFACGQPTATRGRMEAAQEDGREFGEMLMRVGSQEFRRGLLEVLTV